MADTRGTLVDLAEKAMRARGYDGFSYADIAREAGISKASIHHHFPAKADLGLAVLDHYCDRLAHVFDEILVSSRSGAQALGEVIRRYREALHDGSSMCLCAALAAESAVIARPMLDILDRANDMVAERIAQILLLGRRDRSIAVAGDPQQEAIAILAQLQGAQLLARAAGDPARFDDAVTTLVARLARH